MDKKIEEDVFEDFTKLSFYLDKVFDSLNNSIIDYQSE